MTNEDIVHESLSVQELKVLDEKGIMRARVGKTEGKHGDNGFGIVLFDVEGNARIAITDGDKQCRLELFGKEKSRVIISLVKDTEGKIMGVGEMPWITIEDEFSRSQLNMTSAVLGPALYLVGKDGHTMAKIEGASTNMPTVAVCDANGVQRVIMAETLGRAFLGLADENGFVDVSLSRDHGLSFPDEENGGDT